MAALFFPLAPIHKMHLRGSGTCGIFNASRNAGFVAAVSNLALIIRAAEDASFDHEGISPQRIRDNSRTGSFGFWRMTGIGWVEAMLYRGLQSSSPETLSKYSSTSCFLRDSLYRPHMGDYGRPQRHSALDVRAVS
jgi:hypothetical protein